LQGQHKSCWVRLLALSCNQCKQSRQHTQCRLYAVCEGRELVLAVCKEGCVLQAGGTVLQAVQAVPAVQVSSTDGRATDQCYYLVPAAPQLLVSLPCLQLYVTTAKARPYRPVTTCGQLCTTRQQSYNKLQCSPPGLQSDTCNHHVSSLSPHHKQLRCPCPRLWLTHLNKDMHILLAPADQILTQAGLQSYSCTPAAGDLLTTQVTSPACSPL
jgi:hypothetical protein